MGKILAFNLSKEHYQPGEILSGQLLLQVDKGKNFKMRKISILIRGKAEKQGRRKVEAVFYKETIVIFICEVISKSMIPKSSKDVQFLPPGTFTYPFHCRLPDNLLPTYVGRACQISYEVNVAIEPSYSLKPPNDGLSFQIVDPSASLDKELVTEEEPVTVKGRTRDDQLVWDAASLFIRFRKSKAKRFD